MNDHYLTPAAALRSVDDLSELAGKINAAHMESQDYDGKANHFRFKVGEWLTRAKAKVGDGEWERWVEKNCKFTPRTARKYMQIHREWQDSPADQPFTTERAFQILADAPTSETASAAQRTAEASENVLSEKERKQSERREKARLKREAAKAAALASMQLTIELEPAEKERRDANEQLAAWRDAIRDIREGVAELVAGCAGFNLRRQARLSEVPLSESQKESYNVHAGLGALPTYTKVYSWPALDVLEALFDKLTTLNHMRTFE